jgi:hypothetical protein
MAAAGAGTGGVGGVERMEQSNKAAEGLWKAKVLKTEELTADEAKAAALVAGAALDDAPTGNRATRALTSLVLPTMTTVGSHTTTVTTAVSSALGTPTTSATASPPAAAASSSPTASSASSAIDQSTKVVHGGWLHKRGK